MTAGLRRDEEADRVDPGHASRIGPYRLVEQLGEGGMGVVYLALEPSGRAVAIKVLREHVAYDPEARKRLTREVATLARVQDARVAAVLDADTEGARPYIVTRYIPGPALDRVVAEDGPLRGEALVRLGRGLSDALSAIHGAGIIHRDLKPANVVLLDGDPVVIDFGIAHVADDIRLTMTGLVMGTPGYLSPEVVAGAPVTEATDWWGWAATLAFAASGAPPFGRGPMDVVLDRVRRGQADLSGVDRRLAPLLRAALSPSAADRPHADEVVQALDRYAVGQAPTIAVPLFDPYPTLSDPHPTLQYAPASPPPAAGSGRLRAWRQDSPVRDLLGRNLPEQEGWAPQPGSDQKAAGNGGPDLVAGGDGPDQAAGNGGPDQAAGGGEPGQSSPRIGWPSRSGTLLALLVGVLGVAAVWPIVAVGLVVLWSWCARFVDRSMTSLTLRRQLYGRRRRDLPLVVVSIPWHLVVSALGTVLALVTPAVVTAGSIFSIAMAVAAVSGGGPQPNRSAPLVAGGLLGLLMCWWGPGGASLRRGSRSLVRAIAPGKRTTEVVVVTFVLIAAALGGWAWLRHGHPLWWPWSSSHFPVITRLRW